MPSSAAIAVTSSVGGSPSAWPPHPPYDKNAGSSPYDAAQGSHENAVRRRTTLPRSATATDSR